MTTLILDPAAFDAPAMQQEAEAFISWVKASPPAGDAPVQVPGEWEAANREKRTRQGIPLDSVSWQQICQAARQAGMSEAALNRFSARAEAG